MKTKHIALLVAIILIAALVMLSGCGKKKNNNANNDSLSAANTTYKDTTAAPNTATNPNFDLQYLDTMIKHHQDGIETARLAMTNAMHKELKDYAKKLVDDMNKEVTQMQKWRTNWYANAPQDVDTKSMPVMEPGKAAANLTALKAKKGAEFDKAFITMVTEHERQGIDYDRQAQTKATHTELKDKIRQMIDDHQKVLDKLAKMEQDWAAGKNTKPQTTK